VKGERSNLDFTSNIDVVRKDRILDDHDFLSKIIDPMVLPKLLDQFKKYYNTKYRFNEEQNRIYTNASLACEKNDYSWGIVLDEDDRLKPVCRCIREDCEYFGKCRPDFSRDELDVLKENEMVRLELAAIASQAAPPVGRELPGCGAEPEGDEEALVKSGGTELSRLETRAPSKIASSPLRHPAADQPLHKSAAPVSDEVRVLSLKDKAKDDPPSGAEQAGETLETEADGVTDEEQEKERGEVTEADTPPAGAEGASAAGCEDETEDANWYLMLGPYPEERIRAFIANGGIRREMLVWRDEGGTNWVRIDQADGFRDMFAAEPEASADEAAMRRADTIRETAWGEYVRGNGPTSPGQFEIIEQSEFITSPPDRRIIVNAGPGAGKTWSLIERLRHLTESEGTEPENIFVLCFSRAAVSVIETRLMEMSRCDQGKDHSSGWRGIEIRTFDSFATHMILRAIANCPNLLPKGYWLDSQDYDERIKTAIEILKKKDDMLAGYEHFIVDEMQDLVGIRAELVLRVLRSLPSSCGFSLLGDACQAIYDYQSIHDRSVMSSDSFYRALSEQYPGARRLSFSSNYRQGVELAELERMTSSYRRWILKGHYSKMNELAGKIRASLREPPVNLKQPNGDEMRKFARGGTLGILTRTNAQSITISARLRSENIEHDLLRHSESNLFGRWIADIFMDYPHETMSEMEFADVFKSKGLGNMTDDAGTFWNALLSSRPKEKRGHCEVEDLLGGIRRGARDGLLFKDVRAGNPRITISNVHRAKGREFDSVILAGEIFEDWDNQQGADEGVVLEHKVRYVSLTRARREITAVDLPSKGMIYRDRSSGRCFKAAHCNRSQWRAVGSAANDGTVRHISHFEVGFKDDVDDWEFARDKAAQDYIRREMRPDDKLVLKKCPEEHGPHIAYKVVPIANESLILGYTSKKFCDALTSAIRQIFKNNRSPMKYKYYPNELHDVYVDRLTTCVSEDMDGLVGAKIFGGMAVWTGISFFGLAKSVK
jgi:hypothetical protein